MSSREFLVALATLAAGTYAIVTIARLVVHWLSSSRRGLNSAALEDRLARLETAVEGLTVENQRLIEGHRFFTQLIGHRQSSALGSVTGVNADNNSRVR